MLLIIIWYFFIIIFGFGLEVLASFNIIDGITASIESKRTVRGGEGRDKTNPDYWAYSHLTE